MNKKLLALMLGTSIVLAACGGDKADDKPSSDGGTTTADSGQEAKLYKNNCASCHGENLEGLVGPELKKVGATLSKDEIEKVILEGKGSMPKEQLQGEEASQVAQWLSEKK
ncbi:MULTISPECIES: cytochrome c551 [Bacillus]|uniref:cytochrome c551 n=1 Tax=Bacillus TaxID=1386 RepID=UPI0002F8436A|nr:MULTISPECIES: cytochrome c [Bacillus]